MKSLRIYPNNINARYIDEAIEALEDGKLIIYPTDSLYAIGCDATNQRAIENVCRIKDIDPKRQHLAIMCADLSQAAKFARIDNKAYDIMRRNLPGELSPSYCRHRLRCPRLSRGARKLVCVCLTMQWHSALPRRWAGRCLQQRLCSTALTRTTTISPLWR